MQAARPERDLDLELRAQGVVSSLGLIQVEIEAREGTVFARGFVTSPAQRDAALAALRRVPGVREVVDELVVTWGGPATTARGEPLTWEIVEEGTVPPEAPPPDSVETEYRVGHEHEANVEGVEPDFTDDYDVTSEIEAVEEGEPYFPPTDPVVRPAGAAEEGVRIVGGFQGTAMDELDLEGHPTIGGDADAQIAEAVARELLENGMTIDLPLRIVVRNGIVHLRGRVLSLEEAEAAEEVARRVEGVVDVVDELEIVGF